MKATKITAILGSITVTGLLALGCSAPDKATDSSSRNSEKVTSTVAKASPTDKFVDAMKVKYPNATRSDLIQLGNTACEVIESYGSIIDAMVAIASDPTWDRQMAGNAGYTFGAAVPVFCPEYVPELNQITG